MFANLRDPEGFRCLRLGLTRSETAGAETRVDERGWLVGCRQEDGITNLGFLICLRILGFLFFFFSSIFHFILFYSDFIFIFTYFWLGNARGGQKVAVCFWIIFIIVLRVGFCRRCLSALCLL